MILIVDGNNMAHRARHAYQLSYLGKDTGVMYGVMRMLMTLLGKYRPSGVIFCWDGGRPAFRKRLVPAYKAGRSKADDPTWAAFILQLNELEKMLPHTGVLQVKRVGIEADDLMAHASVMVEDEAVIVSSDDDLMQCIMDGVSVLKPGKKNVMYTEELYLEKYGFHPVWHVLYKVLQGDGSDNIPGVPGIGPKTAMKLCQVGGKGILSACPRHLIGNLEEFIQSGAYNAAYTVIDLKDDMAGARFTLVRALENWRRYSKRRIYDWCFSNGFASILESGSLGVTFGSLRAPVFDVEGMRCPVIWDAERSPND
jgi:DNA polymerase-1